MKKDFNFLKNQEIKHQTVRITGGGIESDVYDIREAMRIAKDKNMDLILISPKANPPVCRVDVYDKFLYNKKKKKKENEKNNKSNKTETKEIRFTPNTNEHDVSFKKNHIINFIEKGNRVKCVVFYKGREISHKEKGEILLLKLADELSGVSIVEKMPKLEGNRMSMFLKPKK